MAHQKNIKMKAQVAELRQEPSAMTEMQLKMAELEQIIYDQSNIINNLLKVTSRVSDSMPKDAEISNCLSSPINNVLTNDIQLVVNKLRDNLSTLSTITEILNNAI